MRNKDAESNQDTRYQRIAFLIRHLNSPAEIELYSLPMWRFALPAQGERASRTATDLRSLNLPSRLARLGLVE